jgi:phosphoserine phosphatase
MKRLQNPKLVVLDSEGVLFDVGFEELRPGVAASSWTLITQSLGEEAMAEEREGSARWGRGEFDSYTDWMTNTFKIHKRHGLTREGFYGSLDNISRMPGAFNTLDTLRSKGYIIAVISGGFQNLLDVYGKALGIDIAFTAAEYMFGRRGNLDRAKMLPCDYQGKASYLNALQRALRIPKERTICVVDGVNDLFMAEQAGISINFNGRRELEEVCSVTVRQDQKNLSAILQYIP